MNTDVGRARREPPELFFERAHPGPPAVYEIVHVRVPMHVLPLVLSAVVFAGNAATALGRANRLEQKHGVGWDAACAWRAQLSTSISDVAHGSERNRPGGMSLAGVVRARGNDTLRG